MKYIQQNVQFKLGLLASVLLLLLTACVPGSDLASRTFQLGPDVQVLDSEATRRAVFVGDVSSNAIICAESPPEVAAGGTLGLGLNIPDTVDATANASEELVQLAKTTAALGILREQVEMLCFLTNYSRENLTNVQVARLFEGIIEASSKLAAVEVALAEANLAQAQSEQTVAITEAINAILGNFDIVDDALVEAARDVTPNSLAGPQLLSSEGTIDNFRPTLTKTEFFDLLKSMMSLEEFEKRFGN